MPSPISNMPSDEEEEENNLVDHAVRLLKNERGSEHFKQTPEYLNTCSIGQNIHCREKLNTIFEKGGK